MKQLVIIGASGHGKVIADIARKLGYTEIVFLDDNENICQCGNYPVIGKSSEASRMDTDVIVGIGNTGIRKQIQESIPEERIVTLIHPDAVIAEDVLIGRGTVVMAGSIINPGVKIGKGCIINTSSSVDHDCKVGDYVHIAVGSHLCGTVTVGDRTWIGAGAIVSNNVSIHSNCMIGAGAVVVHDIQESGTYIGVPARRNKEENVKICYVTTISLTIESFFIPQLQYLAVNGFDVTVVCSNDLSLQKKLGEFIRFYPINIPRGISVVGSIYALNELTHFFKKEKFDLIQYSTPNAAFYSSIAAKRVGCKVRNYHLMGLRYLGASGIGRIVLKTLEKIACNNSTSIECVSKSNLKMGIKEGLFSSEKATVVWNGSSGGVDLQRFDFSKREIWRKEIRQKLHYTKDDFVFGFVGRITRDKGINEILEAFFRLSTGKLLFIGNEEDDDMLDQQLLEQARKNSDITFYGRVMDVEKYYAAIDVLLLPSYREGFGNVIIEAAAMGVPAIVSNIPGPIDAVEIDKTALVVPPRDIESLLKAMRKMLTMDYKGMGQQAEEFAREKFDSVVLCRKILERKKKINGWN